MFPVQAIPPLSPRPPERTSSSSPGVSIGPVESAGSNPFDDYRAIGISGIGGHGHIETWRGPFCALRVGNDDTTKGPRNPDKFS